MATREEAEAVHINNVMRDDELERIEVRAAHAVPGQWMIRTDGQGVTTLTRFDKTPVDDPSSLLFAARAREDVPRLLKCVRTWEDAWRTQCAAAKSWKAEYVRAKERHEQDLARAAKHESGPEYEPDELIDCVRLGVIGVRLLKMRLIEWSRGASVMSDLRFALEDARKKEERETAARLVVEIPDAVAQIASDPEKIGRNARRLAEKRRPRRA
ncbi:MAG: hypothetical protein PVSMB8_00200 [Vulcanimicrobiaceae bacterium]